MKSAAKDPHTLIFYEAPHKLVSTLTDMLEYFGDRKISLCRELTKLYEEVIRTTISGAIEYYNDRTPKGEYALVIEGYNEEKALSEITIEEAVSQAQKLIADGMKAVDACKEAAKATGFKKAIFIHGLFESLFFCNSLTSAFNIIFFASSFILLIRRLISSSVISL